MPWSEPATPLAMRRIAVVAPTRHWRSVLAEVADAGVVEPDTDDAGAHWGTPRPGHDASGSGTARPAPDGVDVAARHDTGRDDLVAGEAELERVSRSAQQHDSVTALLGWTPADAVPALCERLAPFGGSVAELPTPAGVDLPTALPARRSAETLRPLVDTYATVPYRDLDPAWFAAVAYVVMFGMMFGDVGDGLVLVAGALLLRRSRRPRLAAVRRVWPLILAMGAAAALFGLLYGEAFGPTGIVPTVWLSPLDEPEQLLLAGIGVGAVLLACAYGIGIVNRWREGGVGIALWAPSGIAGATLFAGLGLLVGGVAWSSSPLLVGGVVLAVAGLVLAFVGVRSEAGPGGAGVAQAGIETFDLTMRLGSNVVSFARLAAFGLMHAAIALVVWDAATSLWGSGVAGALAAIAVFLLGHAVAFALEALVAGVQALRLEYYELFSRIFVGQGRPFHPWHVPIAREETPC